MGSRETYYWFTVAVSYLLPTSLLLKFAHTLKTRNSLILALLAIEASIARLRRDTSDGVARSALGRALNLRGLYLFDQEREAEAINSWLEAHSLDPLAPSDLRRLTRHLLKRRDLSRRARDVYWSYLALDDSIEGQERRRNLETLRRLLSPNLKRRDDLEARRDWNESAAAAAPQLAWPHRHVGLIALKLNDWPNAAAAFKRAIRLKSGDRKTRLLLTYCLVRQDLPIEAKTQVDILGVQDVGKEVVALRIQELRGLVRRRLGRAAEAASDLCHVLLKLPSEAMAIEEALAYAECLVNAGKAVQGQELLKGVPAQDDPRWKIVWAAADQSRGRLAAALEGFSRLTTDRLLGPQAVDRVLQISAVRPGLSKMPRALSAIPERHRDDRYWAVRGNCHLQSGGLYEALDSWRRVHSPGERLSQARAQLALHYSTSLYNSRRYGDVVLAASSGLLDETHSERVNSLVEAALIRHLLPGPSPEQAPFTHGTGVLDQVIEHIPELAPRPQLALFRGWLLTRSGDYRRALEVLSATDPGPFQAEIQRQQVRCLLGSGDLKTAASVLARLQPDEPATSRLKAAQSALAARWKSAARHLEQAGLRRKPDASPEMAAIQAAIDFKAGCHEELLLFDHEGDAVRFFKAAVLAQEGHRAEAEESLSSMDPGDVWRPPADCLRGWLLLQDLPALTSPTRRSTACAKLAQALHLWPGPQGPAGYFTSRPERLLAVFLGADDRIGIRRMLEDQAGARLALPVESHRMFLSCLAEGARAATSGSLTDSLRWWERAATYLAIVLSHSSYIQTWCSDRAIVYRSPVKEQHISSLKERVLSFCEDLFQGSREERSQEDDPVAARSYLGLAMRAELLAAEKLRELGGFRATDRNEALVAGPNYLALHGLEHSFSDFLESLEVKASLGETPSGGDALLWLLDHLLEEKDRGVDRALKESVEYLFSALRLAALLHQQGHLAWALRCLRDPSPPGFPLAGDFRYPGPLSQMDPETAERVFAAGNPAFALPGGIERLRSAAVDLELTILTQLGEQCVSTPERGLEEGMGHWREACELAERNQREMSVRGRIRSALLGRAQVLEQSNRDDQGIELLRASQELFEDRHIDGMLANLYANSGVRAANNDGNWTEAVTQLRRARRLNNHELRINQNLMMALLGLAGETAESDPEEARKLSRQAVEIGEEALATDPHNRAVQKITQAARERLAVLSLGQPGSSPEDMLHALMMATDASQSQSARRLSTFFHNRGVKSGQEGNYEAAERDLKKALELEPESQATRSALAALLNSWGIAKADAGEFSEALRILRRGQTIDPSNQVLQRNLEAISQAHEFEGFTEFLRKLQDEE